MFNNDILKEENGKMKETLFEGKGEWAIGIGLPTIMIAAAFGICNGIANHKDNKIDEYLKELGCYENYMKYNMDNQGSIGYALGVGDIQSKAMYACVVSLAREKGISIDKAAKEATSTFKGRLPKKVKGRITGVSVGKDVNTGERIVRVDSEWERIRTNVIGDNTSFYTTTEYGTVYIPMSEGNVYGIDDSGKSVNIGGATFVFDEAKKELFDNVFREAMKETLFESILSADEEEAEARNVLDLDPRLKLPEDDEYKEDYDEDYEGVCGFHALSNEEKVK